MVDLDKLKPGDRVAILFDYYFPGVNGTVVSGRTGDVFDLGTPAVDWVSRKAALKIPGTATGVCGVDPQWLDLVEPDPSAAPRPCDCDIMRLMSSGCQCGALERERRRAAL